MSQGFNFNIYNVQEVSRVEFIRKTYSHVALAVLAFVGFEFLLFTSGIAESIAIPMIQNWWIVLILFMGAGGENDLSFLTSITNFVISFRIGE